MRRLLRANFEGNDDHLQFMHSSRLQWTAAGMRAGQARFVGGSGGWLINTFGSKLKPNASVMWGPFDGPFSFFGISGGAVDSAHVALEKREKGGKWTSLTNVAIPRNSQVLVPYVEGIQIATNEEIRVIVPKPSNTLLLDSLTLY